MALYTSSTNTDPTKAVYGEKSAGVLALQKALNAKGAGLKEDALYGPLTQAAFNKYNAPTPSPYVNDTSKTIGSTFKIPTLQGETQAEKDYADMQARLSRGEDIVDTSAIRSKTLADFQDRIDAISQVYAGKLAEAKQQGVGRVGSTTAILANRGLTGSPRGGTIAEGTLTQNRQIEDAINAEKSLAIASIFRDIDTTVQEEATRIREAMQAGAKNYIEFIKGQDTRKQTNISNVASALLSQGIDPSTMTPQELNDVANKLGATSGDIITAYKKLKLEENANNLKNFPTKELSQGEALYQYNPVTGYTQVGFNPKTATPTSTNTRGSSKYGSDLDALVGNTVATIPSKFGQAQFQTQLERTRNDADKISLVGSVVLKNAPAEVKRDFSNQAIAVSNIDKAIAEIDKGAKTGFINSKLQKGFNLLGKDYDPTLTNIASYITAAIQPYRNSVTGAAWGEQEEAEYQQLFGSVLYSPTELKQRLTRLKEIMKDKSAQGLNVFINPLDTYANPFIQNAQNTATTTTGNLITVYSVKTGKPAQIPADKLQNALSSGLFKQ